MTGALLEKKGSASAEQTAKNVKLDYFDLNKYSSGPDIEAVLPVEHLFGTAEVYGVIGALIEAQADGQEGPLKNDGNYNIFYSEKFCLSVYWWRGGSGWSVCTWLRAEGWSEDYRVFSPGLPSTFIPKSSEPLALSPLDSLPEIAAQLKRIADYLKPQKKN